MVAAMAELSKLFGQDAVAFTMQFIQNGCKAELQEMPGLLQRIKMDGLVVDRIAPGTGAVAMGDGDSVCPCVLYAADRPEWRNSAVSLPMAV